MAVIKCKMCGGDIELSPDKTFGVCECCGSTMTFPKIDDDQRAAAFNRGNYFRRIGEFDKALAVYERIVEEDNTDADLDVFKMNANNVYKDRIRTWELKARIAYNKRKK